jgi:hypothetical protein
MPEIQMPTPNQRLSAPGLVNDEGEVIIQATTKQPRWLSGNEGAKELKNIRGNNP